MPAVHVPTTGLTRRERKAAGHALRDVVPRKEQAEWVAPADRPDPISVLTAADSSRLADLLPIRYGRMLASPFAFLRGSAGLMALDLAPTPRTGLRVQACGDAHVSNFGEFGTPEQNVVFDINDFDETLPGPFEWDVKRLAVSLEVLLRQKGMAEPGRRAAIEGAVAIYRQRITRFAAMRTLEVWYAHIGTANVVEFFPDAERPLVERDLAKARARTGQAAVERLTKVRKGRRRLIGSPPLVAPLDEGGAEWEEAASALESYRLSLAADVQVLVDHFHVADMARKVVGVGSVGTRCWMILVEGPDQAGGDAMILQVKQAQASVLEAYVGASEIAHHGHRVVVGQRLTQEASDILLGWSTGSKSSRQFYVRQLWNLKGVSDPETMDRATLVRYGQLCAWALARGHARTGDAVGMAAYLGGSVSFDRAIAGFAARYADQVVADHQALVEAVRDGRVHADTQP
jgi:uncharacterized protein (DUF2252 family)